MRAGKREPLTRSKSSAGPPARIERCAISESSRTGSISARDAPELAALLEVGARTRADRPGARERRAPRRRRRSLALVRDAPSGLPLDGEQRQVAQRVRDRARAAASSSDSTASAASSSARCRARSMPPASRQRCRISAATSAGTPSSPSCARTCLPSAGSASQASSTGSVSLPSCRSWPTDLPAVASSTSASSTSSAIWKARPSARP